MSGTTRLCFDSTDPSAIPADAAMVAGYIDGSNGVVISAWAAAFAGRFAHAQQVRIAVLPWTNDGHVLDVEAGDATPASAPGWVKMRRAAGVDPTVYCNRGNWTAIRQAFQQAGVPEPHYWLAAYDNDPTIPDSCVAKQFANEPLTGGNFDLSSVAPVWPGVDGPTPQEEDVLQLSTKMAIVRLAFVAGHGAEPRDMNELTTWANAISDDGTNTGDIVARIMDAPDGQAWRAAIAALIAAGPASATTTVPPHEHSGSVTVK